MKSHIRFATALALAVAAFTAFSIAPAVASHEAHEAHAVSLCSALGLPGESTFGL